MIRINPKSGGWLEVVCGPMFSGKSEEMIRRLRRAEIAGAARRHLQAADRRPLRRGRRGQPRGHPHAGRAGRLASPSSSSARAEFEVVGIDEVQFFEHEIVDAALALADGGARVIAAGLDQDFRRLPFGPMPELLATPSSSTSSRPSATAAAAPATTTQRLVDGAAGALLRRDDRRRRERAVRGALPRLPRGRRRPRSSRGVDAQTASFSCWPSGRPWPPQRRASCRRDRLVHRDHRPHASGAR